jgi:SP family sugar porter-like MFS transporter
LRWIFNLHLSHIPIWCISLLSLQFGVLCAGRIFTGVAIGIASFAVPTYIVEVSSPALRGAFGALNQLQITIGILLAYAIGAPTDWRVLALVSMAPSLVCSACMVFFPETPQWLLERGERDRVSLWGVHLVVASSDFRAFEISFLYFNFNL